MSKTEIDQYLIKLRTFDNNKEAELKGIRQFLENDTDKSFVMYNNMQL
ncbi:MAG: hypothetical protein R3E32_04425 [Chitinophagales bacterium]